MSRCEAMVPFMSPSRGEQYMACGVEPADLHHKITRSRGGLILDDAGETYHHMYLCREHHRRAHDEGKGYQNGLLLRGFVTTVNGKPAYIGPDDYLAKAYPAVQVHT
jgi:hypothetical protein